MNPSETPRDTGKAIRKSISFWLSGGIGIIAAVASIVVFFYSAQQQRYSAIYHDNEARKQLEELYAQQKMVEEEALRSRQRAEEMEMQLQKARDELAHLNARSVVPGRG